MYKRIQTLKYVFKKTNVLDLGARLASDNIFSEALTLPSQK